MEVLLGSVHNSCGDDVACKTLNKNVIQNANSYAVLQNESMEIQTTFII